MCISMLHLKVGYLSEPINCLVYLIELYALNCVKTYKSMH